MALQNFIMYGERNGSTATQRLHLPEGLDVTARSPNGFLSALDTDDFELIRPHLQTAELALDTALVEVGDSQQRAFMPHAGVISIIVHMKTGEHVQIAMIGRDSISGVSTSLGYPSALTNAVVLIPGFASTIDIERLRAAAYQSASLRSALMRHALGVYAQVQQTAGCNAVHSVEARLARCLLQIHDLSGSSNFVLTQEHMAQMIGARRNSVSLVASSLQHAGVIHYSRGHIEILDLDALKNATCECYDVVKSHYERLLRPHWHEPKSSGPASVRRDASHPGSV
jgi:Crp-like helix-turn-helix domain